MDKLRNMKHVSWVEICYWNLWPANEVFFLLLRLIEFESEDQ